MDGAGYDENGWAMGVVAPLAPSEAYALFAAGAEARVDEPAWSHAASRFLGARFTFPFPKHYPTGAVPLADALEIDVAPATSGSPTRVRVITTPIDRAGALRARADAAIAAIGGAGFDALLARARRVWQVEARVEGDVRAPLVVAAVLASVLLGPILPPEGDAIFGVKGARERLAARGWRT